MQKISFIVLLSLASFGNVIIGQKNSNPNNTGDIDWNSELTVDKCTIVYINGLKYLQRDFSKTPSLSFYDKSYAKPNPSVETAELFFKDAAKEFRVPVFLLKAIGLHESNWTQVGKKSNEMTEETGPQGWGIMGLGALGSSTLNDAAILLKLPPDSLKNDARQNIRGAAALLAKYAGPQSKNFSIYEEWIPALKKFVGYTTDDRIASRVANKYLRLLYEGCDKLTLWGEKVKINPQPQKYK